MSPENNTQSNVQKDEGERDVLHGGFLTMLFPGGGGANYRLFIRLIFLLFIIFLIFKYAVPYIKNNFFNK